MKFYPAKNHVENLEDLIKDTMKAFPDKDEQTIRKVILDCMEDEVWLNDQYQVSVKRTDPMFIHLSIKRVDKEPIHDWRDLQAIKNAIVGTEFEAVELYPKESRCVDTANQYHLWVLKSGEAFPIGFDEGRHVHDGDGTTSPGLARQRPLEEKLCE